MNTESTPPVAPVDQEASLEALRYIAREFQLPWSEQATRIQAKSGGPTDIVTLGRAIGLRLKLLDADSTKISSWHLPIILQLDDGTACAITTLTATGVAGAIISGSGGLVTELPLDALLARAQLVAIVRPARAVPDSRVDDYIRPNNKRWFLSAVLSDLRPYAYVLLASVFANILTLSGILFSMQVYDRVVPAESYPTLYVLFGGVVLGLVFDYLFRVSRIKILDLAGKSADLRVSDLVFGHAIRVQNQRRPRSTGTFIAQLRDLEAVREALTSTTVTALVDLPFFVMFLAIYYYLGGYLMLVPLVGFVAMVIPGLLAQSRIRQLSNEASRETSLRNALLVEAVQGGEDIKALQAESWFQNKWNNYNAVAGEAQLRMRALIGGLSTWSHSVQTLVYISVIALGVPLIIAGEMTTGVLVGLSILGSRMMGPMAQVAQLLNRIQQAKISYQAVDSIMRLPVDHPEAERRVHAPAISGNYVFRSAIFRYGDENSPTALKIMHLKIKPGERIAILGKNGAGKSTLLQALSGLMAPSDGEVVLDDIAMAQVDPADIRRDIGLLTQNSRLFFGTLRENITLGAPDAAQDEIQRALKMVGAEDFIRKLPAGLEQVVFEGGQGLSGGQRQSLLLARLIIRQPRIALLDEPTAAMDEATERHFIDQFKVWSEGKTAIIATHRMRVLELVDRIVVIDNGTVALDKPKDDALKIMRGVSEISTKLESRPRVRT